MESNWAYNPYRSKNRSSTFPCKIHPTQMNKMRTCYDNTDETKETKVD